MAAPEVSRDGRRRDRRAGPQEQIPDHLLV